MKGTSRRSYNGLDGEPSLRDERASSAFIKNEASSRVLSQKIMGVLGSKGGDEFWSGIMTLIGFDKVVAQRAGSENFNNFELDTN